MEVEVAEGKFEVVEIKLAFSKNKSKKSNVRLSKT